MISSVPLDRKVRYIDSTDYRESDFTQPRAENSNTTKNIYGYQLQLRIPG